jgi:tetratricopeptide (TPR) repeat protein
LQSIDQVFNFKAAKTWSSCYDPVRAKIRIMPQERVGLVLVGKNPDFFFMKAAK